MSERGRNEFISLIGDRVSRIKAIFGDWLEKVQRDMIREYLPILTVDTHPLYVHNLG